MRKSLAAMAATAVITGVAVVPVAGTIGSAAKAQTTAAQTVKTRIELMKGLFPNFRPVRAIARGESTDMDAAIAGMTLLNADIQKIGALFPPGSGRDVVSDTRAKPEVWSKRAEFDAAVAKLVAESAKMVEVTKTRNVEAIKTQVTAFGQACGGCHEGPVEKGGTFRFEKPA